MYGTNPSLGWSRWAVLLLLLLLALLGDRGARAQCTRDADCDNGDRCTVSTCDLQTNACTAPLVVPGCCDFDYQCAPTDPAFTSNSLFCPDRFFCSLASGGVCLRETQSCAIGNDETCVLREDRALSDCLSGGACTSTSECEGGLPAGDACLSAVCGAASGTCEFSRTDCGAGQSCDAATGACVPRTCAADGDCVDSRRAAACGDPLFYACVSGTCQEDPTATPDPACDAPDTAFCTATVGCVDTPGDCAVPVCRAPGICEQRAIACPRGSVCVSDVCEPVACTSTADCPLAPALVTACRANVCNATSGRCELTEPVAECALNGTEFCDARTGTCRAYSADTLVEVGDVPLIFTVATALDELLGAEVIVNAEQQATTTTLVADSITFGPVIYTEPVDATAEYAPLSISVGGTITDDAGNPISVDPTDETASTVLEFDVTTDRDSAGLVLTDGTTLSDDVFRETADSDVQVLAGSYAATFFDTSSNATDVIFVQTVWDSGDFAATTVTAYTETCVPNDNALLLDSIVLTNINDPCTSTVDVSPVRALVESVYGLIDGFAARKRAVLQLPSAPVGARLRGIRFIASPNATFFALGQIRVRRIPRGALRNATDGCTVGYGYLRNHAAAQQQLQDTVALGLYLHGLTLAEGLTLRPKRGDAFATLLHQWLTFLFNSRVGVRGVPASVRTAIADADADARLILAETGPGLLRPGAPQRAHAIALAGLLHEYNEGLIEGGPFACDAYPPTDDDAAESALLDGQAASETRDRGAWDWAYETDDATGLPTSTLSGWGLAAIGAAVGLAVGLTALAGVLAVQRVRRRRAGVAPSELEMTGLVHDDDHDDSR